MPHDEALLISRLDDTIEATGGDAHLFFRLGLLLSRTGDLDRAADALIEAISHDPNLAPAHYQLGLIFQSKGKLLDPDATIRKACTVLQNAEGIDPALASPYFLLSALYQSIGCVDDALHMARLAVSEKGDRAQYHLQLMSLLLEKGEDYAAWDALGKVKHIDRALFNANIPHFRLRSMLKQGKLAIIPAGFRCFTKGIIREKLKYSQPSLPFDVGFFPPSSIESILKNPVISLEHDEHPVNYSVCIKYENDRDSELGLGIKFVTSSYEEIDAVAAVTKNPQLNRYLDAAYAYYTLDRTHNYVLAHYNWHQFACGENKDISTDHAVNIAAINKTLNRRIYRMQYRWRMAKNVILVAAETQSYNYMKIDDTAYDLRDFSSLLETAQARLSARVFVVNVNDINGPESLLKLIEG